MITPDIILQWMNYRLFHSPFTPLSLPFHSLFTPFSLPFTPLSLPFTPFHSLSLPFTPFHSLSLPFTPLSLPFHSPLTQYFPNILSKAQFTGVAETLVQVHTPSPCRCSQTLFISGNCT